MIPIINTDIVIRLVTGDDAVKQQAAPGIFTQLETGQLELSAPVTMIADAVYVLQSARLYHLQRPVIVAALSTLVNIPGFHVHDRDTVLEALTIYGSTHLDFGDAYIVASMRRDGSDTLYSYDRDFDNIPGVSRREP